MCGFLVSIKSLNDRQIGRQQRLLRQRRQAHPLEHLALEA
jgi:hypothetical protein